MIVTQFPIRAWFQYKYRDQYMSGLLERGAVSMSIGTETIRIDRDSVQSLIDWLEYVDAEMEKQLPLQGTTADTSRDSTITRGSVE